MKKKDLKGEIEKLTKELFSLIGIEAEISIVKEKVKDAAVDLTKKLEVPFYFSAVAGVIALIAIAVIKVG